MIYLTFATLVAASFMNLPAAAQQTPEDELIVPRVAASGSRRRIWKMWDIDDRCETYRGFTVEIEEQPKAGKIELQKVEEIVSLQWINERLSPQRRRRVRECLGRPVAIITVDYTGHGPRGSVDTATISTTNPRTGLRRRVNFQISMR